MRALDEGESFIITRNGVPAGEHRPVGKTQFVRTGFTASSGRVLPSSRVAGDLPLPWYHSLVFVHPAWCASSLLLS